MLGDEGILDVSLLAFVIEKWNLPRNHPCSSALMVHPALSLRPNEIMRVIGELVTQPQLILDQSAHIGNVDL
jgi:hypothetical protein